MNNKQVLIGGFHRSGTSFLARMLHDSGISMGKKMIGSRASNIYGHYEDVQIVQYHNSILAENGSSWMESQMRLYRISDDNIQLIRRYIKQRNNENDCWGFKDPRLCLFPMLWKMLLPEMKMIIVYRHYSNCYASLTKREVVQLVHAQNKEDKQKLLSLFKQDDIILRMWLIHNKHLLNFSKVYPQDVIVMNYEDILKGKNIVSHARDKWKIDLNDISVDNYIDPNIVSPLSYEKIPCSSPSLAREVNDTFNKLQQLKDLGSL